MLNQKELCARAQQELEYAAATLNRVHLLAELIIDSLGGADAEPARTFMLVQIAAELLAPAAERVCDAAEIFYAGGRDE